MQTDLGRCIVRRLNLARQAAKLNQSEAAAAVGVSRQLVGKWERGQSSPNLRQFIGLCELYGVAPAYILLGDTQAPPILRKIMREVVKPD